MLDKQPNIFNWKLNLLCLITQLWAEGSQIAYLLDTILIHTEPL